MSTLTLSAVRQNLSKFDYAGLGLPAMVLLIMAMLVIPLPPLLLDILFTFNIGCSLLVIMIAIGTRKPLEFSSFPSVLLFATDHKLTESRHHFASSLVTFMAIDQNDTG